MIRQAMAWETFTGRAMCTVDMTKKEYALLLAKLQLNNQELFRNF